MEFPNWLIIALRIRKVILGKDFYLHKELRLPTYTLGNPRANWTFFPDPINTNSIVYSFGVGEDISFEASIINLFKLHVYAFDPTPHATNWINAQKLSSNFHFYPYGISSKDGDVEFYPPNQDGKGSHSYIKGVYNYDSIKLPVRRLKSIMHSLGHNKLDILKMDIEGAEYEVIDDLIHEEIFPDQILVEFHHRFKQLGIEKTKRSIKLLREAGYRIFYVSPTGEEISFIRNDVLT